MSKMVVEDIKIRKIPCTKNNALLSNHSNERHFGKMPILYLEFLENKEKVIPSLVNKTYTPGKNIKSFNDTVREPQIQNNRDTSNDREETRSDTSENRDHQSDVEDSRYRTDKFEKYDNRDNRYKDTSNDREETRSDTSENRDHQSDVEDSRYRTEKYDNRDNRYKDTSNDREETRSDTSENRDPQSDVEDSRYRTDKFEKYDKNDRDNRYRDTSNKQEIKDFRKTDTPPTLDELSKQGGFTIKKEYNNLNYEDDDDDSKRELLLKFDILRKQYPSASIPEFSLRSEYSNMKKVYSDSVRRLSLDSTIENYKKYLIGAFMISEFVFGKYLGFDMVGFTQQQISSMNSYDKLLIELGEKSYVPEGAKQLPVEIRLILLIGVNSMFFVGSKAIGKHLGGVDILGYINNMNTANASSSSPPVMEVKRKMQGPGVYSM